MPHDRLFARVTTIEGDLDDEVLAFRERVLREAQALPGFRGAVDLVDRARGRAIAVTLWESEDALHGSERARRPQRTGGPAIEVFEATIYPPESGREAFP